MTTPPHSSGQLFLTIISVIAVASVIGLGSTSTIAVTYGHGSDFNTTVCGITATNSTQSIQCYVTGTNQSISVNPSKTSFSSISGGQDFFCGLRSDGLILHCWNTSQFLPKRIYFDPIKPLSSLTVGDTQICAVESGTDSASCWRSRFPPPATGWKFRTITSGGRFSCGILLINSKIRCWGESSIAWKIQTLFGNYTMISIAAGEDHACGVTRFGILICKGRNEEGQLNVPPHSAFEFSSFSIALGRNYSCAIKKRNGIVVCWGGGWRRLNFNVAINNLSFESIASGLDFVCGLTTRNLTIICWGPGWNEGRPNVVPIGMVIPGPCVETSCNICGVYPDSGSLCGGSGIICRQCEALELPQPALLPPISPEEPLIPKGAKKRVFFIYCIVGSIGVVMGISSIIYCLWIGICSFSCKNVHDSMVQNSNALDADSVVPSKSSSIKTGSLGRQKSGTSSRYVDKAEEFSLAELASATNNFSMENKIGGGSFGIVYKGNLFDGREVAIKRGESSSSLRNKKFQEKETAFDSEVALLSRLHHKHLVELIGFCQENEERLLVYEFMSNGSLHDHLHGANKINNCLNSWRMRIKIALDAARGIEYLHDYAVPPIIHRDIKSSNILIDANWTARVSDFGLSLSWSSTYQEPMSRKAVGTVGYIDPEYFLLKNLTAKSDVYGFGVVLLELLTGKRAVFKDEGASPTGLVEFSVPRILGGELSIILDKRVELPDGVLQAVKIMANTALQCVNSEGEERPYMSEVVANFELALAVCDDSSHGIVSDTSFS